MLAEAEGAFYCVGNSLQKSLVMREDKPMIFKVDKHGEPEWHRIYEDDNPYFCSINLSRDLLHLDGSIYYTFMELSFQPEWRDLNYVPVLRYHVDSDELSTHYVVRDTATNFHPPASAGLLETYNGNIALLMNQNIGTDVPYVFIQEIDPLLPDKVLNEFRYQHQDYSLYAYDIVKSSGSYFISGEAVTIEDPRMDYLFLMEVDAEWNFSKIKFYTDTEYGGSTHNMTVDHDDDIVIATTQLVVDPTVPIIVGITSRPIITKFDAQLDVVWQRPLGQWSFEEDSVAEQYDDVIVSHDQDGYILVGSRPATDTINIGGGILAKLSTEGDSIFYRVLQPMEKAVSAEFRDVIHTSDNYYMTVSTMTPWVFKDELFHKTWLLKFDEEGHVVNVDRTNVEENSFSPEVSIFPNPSSDYIYIEHDDLSEVSYSVYNSAGQLMIHKENTAAYHTYIMDVSSWQAGKYFLEIIDREGQRYVEQLLVGR